MSILIITGSYPPDICGVGDYTYKLKMADQDDQIHIYYSNKWSITSLYHHIREICKRKIDIINMQYPTQGYGWSIVPHLLCIYFSIFTSKKFSVTIHEQSQLSLKARIAQFFIILFANKIIFTNEFERLYAIKRYPGIKQRSQVIKIFSNISSASVINKIEDREYDIVNFGHIRPRKGLEKFIAEMSKISKNYNIVIAGQIPFGYEEYFDKIKDNALRNNIKILTNLKDCDVSYLLNNTKLVYLPFPDGASERRGSLLASLANGAVVVSSKGAFTTEELYSAIIDSDNINFIKILQDIDLLKQKQGNGIKFLKENMPNGWNDVLYQYIDFLNK